MADDTEAHRRLEVALMLDEQFVRNYGTGEEWRAWIVSAHELQLHAYERACPLCRPEFDRAALEGREVGEG